MHKLYTLFAIKRVKININIILDQNSSKTIPFGASRTYIAYIILTTILRDLFSMTFLSKSSYIFQSSYCFYFFLIWHWWKHAAIPSQRKRNKLTYQLWYRDRAGNIWVGGGLKSNAEALANWGRGDGGMLLQENLDYKFSWIPKNAFEITNLTVYHQSLKFFVQVMLKTIKRCDKETLLHKMFDITTHQLTSRHEPLSPCWSTRN